MIPCILNTRPRLPLYLWAVLGVLLQTPLRPTHMKAPGLRFSEKRINVLAFGQHRISTLPLTKSINPNPTPTFSARRSDPQPLNVPAIPFVRKRSFHVFVLFSSSLIRTSTSPKRYLYRQPRPPPPHPPLPPTFSGLPEQKERRLQQRGAPTPDHFGSFASLPYQTSKNTQNRLSAFKTKTKESLPPKEKERK